MQLNDVVYGGLVLRLKPYVASQSLNELLSRVHLWAMLQRIIWLQDVSFLNAMDLLTANVKLSKLYIRYAPLRSLIMNVVNKSQVAKAPKA